MTNGFYDAQHFVAAAADQRKNLEWMLKQASDARAAHIKSREPLLVSYQAALDDLGVALLPDMSPQAMAWALALTRYTPFVHSNPIDAMSAEEERLRARLAVIEADPAFANAELLRHPRTGTLTRQLAEAEEMLRPWQLVLDAARHDRLDRLLEVGYGTERYDVPFWRVSYYEDWKAGDEIVERFPTASSFAEIAVEVRQAMETVGSLSERQRQLTAEWSAGAQLEREHARRIEEVQTLGSRYLGESRRRLVTHLIESDRQTLAPLLEQDANVKNFYLRATGIGAKVTYLDQVVVENVDKVENETRLSITRLDRDVAKMQRPKAAHQRIPAEQFDKRFRDRSEKYRKHWERYHRTYSTVYVFDRYDRGSLVEDFLWWDLMTSRRYDAPYIAEVSNYRHRYGDDHHYVPVEDEGDLFDHAAGVIAHADHGSELVDELVSADAS